MRNKDLKSNLGIIEGFYGKPWGFAKRQALVSFMKAHNYGFYMYAPKADTFLRENWQEPVPAPLLQKLKTLGEQLKESNIQWAIGLSPFDLHQNFNEQAKEALLAKIEQLSDLGINYLAILFDDMNGDFPDLAERQIEICHFVQANFDFDNLLMCPSYYCFDPILENVFGKMPENYLEDLGRGLDPSIDIFWTGEKVCSQAYSLEHLETVSRLLCRKPFLWDNYPVNDGAAMSPFLHLSAFSGREHCHDQYVAGVAVNPMNEAFLSQIPMASLNECLLNPNVYQPQQSFRKWSEHFLGDAAKSFISDKNIFEEQGLHILSEEQKNILIKKYSQFINAQNQNIIEELIEYLQGEYLSDVNDVVPTQLLWE
jgi:hypothetical protein